MLGPGLQPHSRPHPGSVLGRGPQSPHLMLSKPLNHRPHLLPPTLGLQWGLNLGEVAQKTRGSRVDLSVSTSSSCVLLAELLNLSEPPAPAGGQQNLPCRVGPQRPSRSIVPRRVPWGTDTNGNSTGVPTQLCTRDSISWCPTSHRSSALPLGNVIIYSKPRSPLSHL